ncbi:MAG TPA: S8 family serine peptidase [Hyphomicrobium sp.]|nr:S8 family serine peptidase [Hyphomicrobium sp.]
MRFSSRCSSLAVLLAVSAWSPSQAQQIVDAEFDAQWGLAAVGAQYALAKGLTGAGVVIGIVDGVVQLDHPEFAGRVFSYQFNPLGEAPDHHGTHVAGIASAGRNGFGMEGVAPDSFISSINAFIGATPLEQHDNAAIGYRGALDAGVRIFNNSWGPNLSPITNYDRASAAAWVGDDLMAAFSDAVSRGAVLVFATGNDHADQPGIPSGLPYLFPEFKSNWIDVTAVDKTLQRAGYADACGVAATWCIAAPGSDIYSTVPTDDYSTMGGTSMAAPMVTGAVAIAAQMFPNASGAQLASIVLRTATDIGDPGIDAIYGWGLLNIGNLVATTDASTGSVFTNAAFGRFAAADTAMTTLWNRSAQRIMQAAGGGSAPVAVAQGPAPLPGAMALGGPGAASTAYADDTSVIYARGPAVWAQGLLGHASIDASASAAKAGVDVGGVIGGYELLNDGPWHAGIAIAYTKSDLGGADNASAEGWHGFAYGTWKNDGWFVDGLVGGNWFDNSYRRSNIAGAAGTVLGQQGLAGASDNDTRGFAARLTAGRVYGLGPHAVMPYVYASWLHQRTGGAAESGADIFSVAVDASTIDQAEGGIGMRAEAGGIVWQAFSIRPSVDVAYARLGGDVAFPVGLELLGTPIAARATDIGRDVLRVGAQLTAVRIDEAVTGFVGYDGRFQEAARNNTFSGGLIVRF